MALGFNATGVNSLTALVPANGGLGGLLSDNGNVVNCRVLPGEHKGYDAAGPGATYEMTQRTGERGPRVVWEWRVKTDTRSDMNAVEHLLRQYFRDGRPYAIEASDGRTSSTAVLLPPGRGSRLVQPVRRTSTGAYVATWRLEFAVLVAGDAAGEL